MQSNRFNLLLIIFLSMVLLFTIYTWMLKNISEEIKNESTKSIHTSKKILIEELISLGIDKMRPLIFDIARNETAMEAFNNNDTKMLKEKLMPTYIRLSTIGTTESIQLFDSTNKLAFSAPNILDNRASVLVKKARIFKKIFASPFFDSENKLALGIAFPLYEGNSFSGTVILTKHFDYILEHFNNHDNSTSTIISNDDYLNRNLPDIWKGFRMPDLYKDGHTVEKIGEKYFRIFAIPIFGSEDKVIAYILNSKDFTKEYKKIQSKLDYFTMILLVSSVFIISFIYLYALKYSKIIYKNKEKH